MDRTEPSAEELHALDHVFMYHAPNAMQTAKIAELRMRAHAFVKTMLELCPRSADRSAAIRHVREALMTANASIVLDGRNLP